MTATVHYIFHMHVCACAWMHTHVQACTCTYFHTFAHTHTPLPVSKPVSTSIRMYLSDITIVRAYVCVRTRLPASMNVACACAHSVCPLFQSCIIMFEIHRFASFIHYEVFFTCLSSFASSFSRLCAACVWMASKKKGKTITRGTLDAHTRTHKPCRTRESQSHTMRNL